MMETQRSLGPCMRCGAAFEGRLWMPVVVFVTTKGVLDLQPTDLRMCIDCGSNGANTIRETEYITVPLADKYASWAALQRWPVGSQITFTLHTIRGSEQVTGVVTDHVRGHLRTRTESGHGTCDVHPKHILS